MSSTTIIIQDDWHSQVSKCNYHHSTHFWVCGGQLSYLLNYFIPIWLSRNCKTLKMEIFSQLLWMPKDKSNTKVCCQMISYLKGGRCVPGYRRSCIRKLYFTSSLNGNKIPNKTSSFPRTCFPSSENISLNATFREAVKSNET